MKILSFFFLVCVIFFASITSAQLTPKDTCEQQYFLTGASPSAIFTIDQINLALRTLNNERRNISVHFPNHKPNKARGMPMVKWDQAIADHAHNYQKDCPGLVHSSSTYRRSLSGYSYLGENLYVSSGGSPDSLDNAFSAWDAGERPDYTYGCGNSNCNGGVVGHYTQDMWAETVSVGCSYVSCSTGWKTQINCQYFAGGNIGGQNPWTVSSGASDVADCQTNGGASVASSPGATPSSPASPGATPSPLGATPNSNPTPSPASPNNGQQQPTSSDSDGLFGDSRSVGEKAGIGIGLALGCLLVIGLIGFAVYKYSTSSSSSSSSSASKKSYNNAPNAREKYYHSDNDGDYFNDDDGTDWYLSRSTGEYFWYSHEHGQWVAAAQ